MLVSGMTADAEHLGGGGMLMRQHTYVSDNLPSEVVHLCDSRHVTQL
jgi:hypothetical protein